MCFNEYIAYQCGHRSNYVVRPCPLTTAAQNLTPCTLRAFKQSHALTMCVACERVLHFRWILVREFEHRWMHERGVCGCDVQFPGILYTPRVSGDVAVEKGKASVPAPYTETTREGEHHVSVRISGLYAAEWIADHKKLHETGACKCGISFNPFQPSVQGHDFTPAERDAVQNVRHLENSGADMTPEEIATRVAEITRLFGVFMPIPPAPQAQRGHGSSHRNINNSSNGYRSGQGSSNTNNNNNHHGLGQNRKKRRAKTQAQASHAQTSVSPPSAKVSSFYPGQFAVPPPYPIAQPASQPQEYQAPYYLPALSTSGPGSFSGHQVPYYNYMPVSSAFRPDPRAPPFLGTTLPAGNSNNQFGSISTGSNSGTSSRRTFSPQTVAPTTPTLWAPTATEIPGSSPATLYGPGPFTTTGLDYMYPPVSHGRSASAPPDMEMPLCGLPVGAGPEGTSHVPDWSLCRLGRDGESERSESPSAWSL